MDALKFIKDQMAVIEVPYEFGEWTQAVNYPYTVGELSSPEDISAEDGGEVVPFIVNGFHRGSYLTLEEIKQKIKKHFHPVHGLRAQTENGAIAVFYDGAFFVQTNEADLKRIQINLTIKSWRGDI